MTYPDTPPRRKRIAEVQSDDPDKVWQGHCENCGDDENYPHFHVEEGPLTGPSVICKECIRLMTPHLLHSGRPAISRLRGQDRERPTAVVIKERDLEEIRRKGYKPKKRRRKTNNHNGQLSLNLSEELPAVRSRPNPAHTMETRIKKAKTQDVTQPAVAVEKPKEYYEEDLIDGVQCHACLRLIRRMLDQVAVAADEKLCLDCFEERYRRLADIDSFFADAVWVEEHQDELDKDWRISYVDHLIQMEEQPYE